MTRPVEPSYRYLLGRNAVLFARKHATVWQFAKLLTLMILGLALRMAVLAVTFFVDAVRGQLPWVRGCADGFRRRLRPERAVRPPQAVPWSPANTPWLRIVRWVGGCVYR